MHSFMFTVQQDLISFSTEPLKLQLDLLLSENLRLQVLGIKLQTQWKLDQQNFWFKEMC